MVLLFVAIMHAIMEFSSSVEMRFKG